LILIHCVYPFHLPAAEIVVVGDRN
jgi:hypothetical protein